MNVTVNGKSPGLKIVSLADLKRALAIPGVVVKMIGHSDEGRWRPDRLAEAKAGRTVAKLQGNAFVLNATTCPPPHQSWMQYGKAADWQFPGDDCAIFVSEGLRIAYQLVPPEGWDRQ